MRLEIKNIAIVGCGGAIGFAFTKLLSDTYTQATIHAFSRKMPSDLLPEVNYHTIDYSDESEIEKGAMTATSGGPLDLVIVAIGMLHENSIMPEKSLSELSDEKFLRLFEVNAIYPALIAKHFLPKLNDASPSYFAALSARIGSISDNQLGGWYAYRASKAALNMFLKTASIEVARSNKQAVIVGLHPGTVDSPLSKPFQNYVKKENLLTPSDAANKLLEVLSNLKPSDSGKCFAWDGKEILP